jgi:ribose 5-phosphate isomerase B
MVVEKYAMTPASTEAPTEALNQVLNQVSLGPEIEKTLVFGADHAGVGLKAQLIAYAHELGYKTHDVGTYDEQSVDYPDFAQALAGHIAQNPACRGVLICGSGIGISIAANRHPHIRAALCTQGLMAKLARAHNNANVLALGARLIGVDVARECLYTFLTTDFEGGRHMRRVDKLSTLL